MRLGYALCALVVATSFSRIAAAQQLALDRFDPAPAGDQFFGVDAPPVPSTFSLRARASFDWGHNPLVLRNAADYSHVYPIVRNQVFGNVGIAMEAFKRLTLYVDLPIALGQSGQNIGLSLTQPNGDHVGDLRFGGRVVLLAPNDLFRLSVGGFAYAPIGDSTSASGAYVSDGHWRGRAEVILNGTTDRILWSVAAGPDLHAHQTFIDVRQGTNIRAGAAIAVRLLEDRSLQIGPEATTLVNLDKSQARNWNFEGLMGIRYKGCSGFEAGAGAGPGFTRGVGTPDFRVVAMIGMGTSNCPKPQPPPPDTDNDGIIDTSDACPSVAGVATGDPTTNGCPPPPPDRDSDSILDTNDACPDEPGIAADNPQTNGCPPLPPDRDSDGVFDSDDACPDKAGVKSGDPTTNGCPAPVDSDGDGINDEQDACPQARGASDPRPERNGCPLVQVIGKQVVMLDQVQFATGSAKIKPQSAQILEGILAAIKTLPESTRFRVEGHTDNRGKPAGNRLLSKSRARAVVTWLAKHGVNKKRFDVVGHGPDKPIGSNADMEGRTKNRRVEIHILD